MRAEEPHFKQRGFLSLGSSQDRAQTHQGAEIRSWVNLWSKSERAPYLPPRKSQWSQQKGGWCPLRASRWPDELISPISPHQLHPEGQYEMLSSSPSSVPQQAAGLRFARPPPPIPEIHPILPQGRGAKQKACAGGRPEGGEGTLSRRCSLTGWSSSLPWEGAAQSRTRCAS